MYIKSARIQNIRSIEDFEIIFDEPAGWHVLIGDNGSGKSTIIRSLALALVGDDEIPGLRANWREWLNQKVNGLNYGKILLEIELSEEDRYPDGSKIKRKNYHSNATTFRRSNDEENVIKSRSNFFNLIRGKGWFSVAYGPHRRFSGGNREWNEVYANQPKLGAHLSAFGEDVALTEATEWLIKLRHQEIEKFSEEILKKGLNNKVNSFIQEFKQKNSDSEVSTQVSPTNQIGTVLGASLEILFSSLFDEQVLRKLQNFRSGVVYKLKLLINSSGFLPNNTKLEKISSEGVFFKDGNGNQITVEQLSDGYRSILSLTLELIRQLIRVYGEEAVFKNIREDNMYIDLPGVVLIDEIDAHLYPTWQTKIGQWFLKYFPNLQFIVTTHSPLVCRAAEKGTIWKLAAPGSGEKSEQVTGIERERLIKGNILDAYGTEVFGKNITISKEASNDINRLAELNLKSMMGDTNDGEEVELQQLKSIYPTEKVV